jgi:UDPglucose 6-dehydrogenase/UDP-N-acetyl-D-galactosamine dehydrogenase
MPGYVAGLAIKGLNEVGKVIKNSKILIMGLTYKENVPDIRESPVQGIIKELNEYNIDIYGYDPLISIEEISKFGIKPVTDLDSFNADCLIITVAHTEFRQLSVSYLEKLCPFERPVIIDVKGILKAIPGKGIYKRL